MAIEAKICGITTADALAAARAGGARYAGFCFYPPSPRAVTPEQAAALIAQGGAGLARVALFVDPDDAVLSEVLGRADYDLIQLHGAEPPRRVAEIHGRFTLPVMKAIKVARPEDLAQVDDYAKVAARILFDAKAPKTMTDALPGGNAVAFDWRMLTGKSWSLPWMLGGGLRPDNLRQAVEISGALAVDVSSGVEARPGLKDPEKIREFLSLARDL
jgi:phosphoribosylanthranilate isomerase